MIQNNESPTQLRSVPPELEAVLRRKGYILLVKGDTGTGKTNLALELMALLHAEGDSVHISTRTYPEKLSFQHALFWGGLRGALALALALAVPATVPERGAIILTAFVVVAFSILVQGLTMPWLIRRLGLGRKQPVAAAAPAP